MQIRKKGYPFRLSHTHFFHRFNPLLSTAEEREGLDNDSSQTHANSEAAQMQAKCEALLARLPSCERVRAAAKLCLRDADAAKAFSFGDDAKVGKGRVFYRPLQSRVLEVAREKQILEVSFLFQRWGRGAVARGCLRRLRATREQIAAAMVAKKLEAVEAAMEALQARQVAFQLGERVMFTLHVPNMGALMTLRADLAEEIRCNDTLNTLLREEDLDAAYPQIQPEILIAKRLLETLGRPVDALAPAECLCGLKEGVEEHDRERMQAALDTAEQLGLAPRLVKPIALAQREIEVRPPCRRLIILRPPGP
jgi:myosin heavy subunit